jgi:hypothetical protein
MAEGNGQVCCLLGVCCPPGSAEQEQALAEFLMHELAPDAGPVSTNARQIARTILGHFDLAPKGTLAPLVRRIVDITRAHPLPPKP